MGIKESIDALQSCSDCDRCQPCGKVADAIREVSRIVSCHDCIYFEPPKETRWGWCRNSRCKTLPNGFCDEGLRKENTDKENGNKDAR